MPHSSSIGMQAMTPAGMPGTRICEGRVRNGNGISEPISTSGFHARRVSIAQTLGEKHHRRNADAAADQQRARPSGCGVKPLPIGPSTLTVSPALRAASACSPGPTTL